MTHIHNWLTRLCLLMFLAVVASPQARPQATSGSVSGFVTDNTGAAIPGATISISNSLSGLTRTATGDGTGAFHFGSLPFNHYHLSASAKGFASATGDAEVRSVGDVVATLKLNIASESTVVNVEAEASDMVSTEASSATTIDRVIIDRLPVEDAASGLSSVVTLSTWHLAGLQRPLPPHG